MFWINQNTLGDSCYTVDRAWETSHIYLPTIWNINGMVHFINMNNKVNVYVDRNNASNILFKKNYIHLKLYQLAPVSPTRRKIFRTLRVECSCTRPTQLEFVSERTFMLVGEASSGLDCSRGMYKRSITVIHLHDNTMVSQVLQLAF